MRRLFREEMVVGDHASNYSESWPHHDVFVRWLLSLTHVKKQIIIIAFESTSNKYLKLFFFYILEQSNCTGLREDGIIGCRLEQLSNTSVKVIYELGKFPSNPPIKYWCNYRGILSPSYTQKITKKRFYRNKRLQPRSMSETVEQSNSAADEGRLRKYYYVFFLFWND